MQAQSGNQRKLLGQPRQSVDLTALAPSLPLPLMVIWACLPFTGGEGAGERERQREIERGKERSHQRETIKKSLVRCELTIPNTCKGGTLLGEPSVLMCVYCCVCMESLTYSIPVG